MKTSSLLKKKIFTIIFKILIIIYLVISTCMFFNALLITPFSSTKIGTTMADINRQEENIDIVFLGSSRTYRAVDTVNMSENLNKNIFNVATDSVSFTTLYHLLLEVDKTNDLETVYLEYSMAMFKRENSTNDHVVYRLLSGENKEEFNKAANLNYENFRLIEFTNYMENFSNGRFVSNIGQWFNTDKTLGSGIQTNQSVYMGNGFVYASKFVESEKELMLPTSYYTDGKLWKEDQVNSVALEYFYKIIDYTKQNNIELILFSPPYPEVVTRDNYTDFNTFDTQIENFIQNHEGAENLKVLNFTKIKKNFMELSIENFYNANHCNGKGARLLTPLIEQIYLEIKNNTYNKNYWFYNSYEELLQDYNN